MSVLLPTHLVLASWLAAPLWAAAPSGVASIPTESALPARHAAGSATQLQSGPGEVVLVLPLAGEPDGELDWFAAGAARYLAEAIRLAGFRVVEEEDRRAALLETGLLDLPRLPLASAVVLSRALGARFVVTGEWSAEPGGLRLKLRAIDAESLALIRQTEIRGGGPEWTLDQAAREITGATALAPAVLKSLEALASTPTAALLGWMRAASEPELKGPSLRSALAAAPGWEPARLAWVEHLLDEGRTEEVGPALRGLTESSERHRRARAHCLEGRIAMAQGQHQEAVKALERAAAELPETGTLLWLAEAQLAAGDSGGAGRTVQQALAQSPSDAAALELLVRARDAATAE